MSVYLTEEEQLQAIKKWWNKYSNIIVTVLSIILIIVAGYRYWTWHQSQKIAMASSTYEQLIMAYSNKDNKSIRAYVNQLITNYPHTIYADASRLLLAKLLVAKDKYAEAEKELFSVINNTRVTALKQVARIRLAKIQTMNKAWDEALKTLSVVDDNAYLLMINELKGDIYAMTGDYQKAIDYYKMAINDAKNSNVGDVFLEMKSNELAARIQAGNVGMNEINRSPIVRG